MAIVLSLAGCKAAVERPSGEAASEEGGWTAAPRIRAVEQQREGLVVRGEASPGARVVLRGGPDTAYAAAADVAGRFELRIAALETAMVLIPEVQIGQDSTPGRERLLVADEGRLAALLMEGGASRRLSAGPALDSIDGDGRGLVASGRAATGTQVQIALEGGPEASVSVDDGGRWIMALPSTADRPVTVTVNGVAFAYPGPANRESLDRVERVGEGWRMTRALSSAARQTSWFPDA